ncbi:hypothetical protein HBI88_152630 [Parastagonospora nodorum]|nr:hypothetical protein HBI97_038610 [Parastagonospora nodorum]KAH5832529.1 hypothetical protein HBI96_015340 [Parastagonospora nodorum]KAH5835062.1 hypothetical protein HBI94_015850 [Parastagonospora nodorum]KAH5840631.1 hypothetical protein HBI93_036630 [Parastagonospora nodorum]KAH5852456.1 hypothetical protein HBI90_203590 [Parastagonospora nodorum]
MSQTNVREGYRITTLEVVKLVEDLISYYSAKVKTEDLSNTLTLTLSKTAQRRSSSVVSNRSTASITDKFSVASLTKPAILNDANVALVDAVHYSVVKQFPMFRLITKESQQKLEKNYFEVIDALTMTLIKDDDDLLGTVNSYIKSRRLGAVMLLCQTTKPPGDSNKDGPPLKRRKTEAADSRHAKASGGRTKKDKDSEDSDTSSDVPRLRRRDRAAARARLAERKQLGKEAQLKKTRDEEELAKAKKEKEEKEAQKRETQPDGPLDSDDYRSDSSSDINPEDDSEDEEATTAKDLAREQKERLKALLNAKTRDSLSARVETAIEHYAYILYFKELSSNNGGIFANAMGMGKTRAIVLATEVQNARAEGDAIEHNAVNDDDKLCPTKGERTFYCACERSPSFNAEPQQAATMMTGRPTKEEAMKMRIDTTDAISKALAAANKLVALQSYVLGGVDHRETATKHRLALLAARFMIVCGFRKVDKHVFRAYNTISVTAQRTIIRKGSLYVEKRAILLPGYVTIWGRTVFDEFHNCKSEGTIIAKDILEKEGLNELEASRRVIFNCFKMQAIASYLALATLKAAQFKTYSSCKVKRFTSNSVKDLFTNLSKDHFLVREARAITKSSLKFQNLLNLCSELGLREKFSNESVLVMQRGMTQHEINLKLTKWRDLDRPWIIVALIAFAEAITLTEATHVVIIELQDRQNIQDQFMF